VLELSSFQLHYLKPQKVAPAVAVVTNLAPNHLDWHGTVLRYYEDKRNLLRFQKPSHWVVLSAEDATLRAWAEDSRARVLLAGREDPGTEHACFVRGYRASGGARRDPDPAAPIVVRIEGRETELAPAGSLRLPGPHNLLNALQAAAGAFAYSGNALAVAEGLASFGGLPHRLEEVGRAGGRRFVNDSKSTTPESSILALESFPEPKVLIAGGYDKGAPFDSLGKAIVRFAHAVVLIGATAPKIREAIEKAMAEDGAQSAKPPPAAAVRLPLVEAGTVFEDAVRKARELCPPGGVVLLSPACASFDMFVNYEARGERFREIVRSLA
jgi:UDP-N-acetylmuramoylalanine--D-glutamate ligase